ncbi:MAG: V-type ATP synthase subunit I, partial [Nanoarchaeota archaeon]
KVNEVSEAVSRNNHELSGIEELRSKNLAILNELKLLAGISLPLEAFEPYNSLAIFTGYVNDSYDISYLKDSLSKETEKFEILQSPADKKIFIALFVNISKKEYAAKSLQKAGFVQVNLSNLGSNMLDRSGSASESIKKIELQMQKLDYSRERAISRLEKLADENKNFFLAAEEFLSNELEKAEAPLRFAATKDAFLIKGWVPAEQLNSAIENLNKAGKNQIFMHSEPANHEDKVPIKLKNEKYSKPFEFFINMYSLPMYREIDPTFFMFLTYPIFFGFMLGDFGYGIVSFALFYFLKKKMPKGAALFNVLLLSSVSSIFFGLIYGEFFGLEELGNFHIPNLISRSHSVFELMYISIAIGVIHVNWGLAAGFANVLKGHGLKHAIFEKASWFVLEIGILLLVLSYIDIIAVSSVIGWIFFAVAAAMLYKGEGIRGIIEIPTILTNTLSYLRLMAIGLSSVSIAVVVNEMAEGFFHEGGFLIFAGILVLLIGHILNIVLGLFGSFLHSLRLHYVEFFSKFFEGGAEKYRPFGAKEE